MSTVKKARNKLTRLWIGEISLCPEGKNPEARVSIVKARPAGKGAETMGTMEQLTASLEQATDQIETLNKALADRDAEVKKAKDDLAVLQAEVVELKKAKGAVGDTSSDDDVLKAIDGPAAIAVKRLQQQLAAATGAIEGFTKAKEENDAIEKARSITVADPKVLGPLLVRVEKGRTTAEDAATLTGILKAASEQSKVALFKPAGSTGTRSAAGTVASAAGSGRTRTEVWADIEKAADEIVEKAANGREMTKEQKIAHVTINNPALYSEWLAAPAA